MNEVFPVTQLTTREAKQRLGLHRGERTMLFFGRIAPYKGLDYLVPAVVGLARKRGDFRLIIAGKIEKGHTDYWEKIQREISLSGIQDRVITKIAFIPDGEVELYFKAADVLIIPYIHIFQSGVPFLAYSFGLPVIATDVGSLREDIIEGRNGLVCKPCDAASLAESIETYFSSELYRQLEHRRQAIRDSARERHSWTKVGEITQDVYSNLLKC
jgi:D-inositol-3-phosphate glycosyltransferase